MFWPACSSPSLCVPATGSSDYRHSGASPLPLDPNRLVKRAAGMGKAIETALAAEDLHRLEQRWGDRAAGHGDAEQTVKVAALHVQALAQGLDGGFQFRCAPFGKLLNFGSRLLERIDSKMRIVLEALAEQDARVEVVRL